MGLIQQFSGDSGTISRVMAFDFVSPWAFVSELSSTHPLTGKRIQRLGELSVSLGREKLFNIKEVVDSLVVDKTKLYGNFFIGVIMYYLPAFAVFAGLVSAVIFETGFTRNMFLFVGVSIIIQTLYKFPLSRPEKTTIRELMSDIYASPMRGKKVLLEGKIIGRGEAGALLSEDMMFQDSGALIYLDYKSSLGFLGNLFFALTKIKKIIGQFVSAEGWFFRGLGQMISLDNIVTQEGKINSHPLLWGIVSGVFFIALGYIYSL